MTDWFGVALLGLWFAIGAYGLIRCILTKGKS
jgi:hypothetical protein